MKHLVYLDSRAGELERILSGTKTMLIREFDPAGMAAHPVSPGDILYFLRDKDDCEVRVSATVVRVLHLTHRLNEDLSHALKAMQPRLQLTEEQYYFWSARKQIMLVEFESAHKIGVLQVPAREIADRPDWVAFEQLGLAA